MNFLPGIPLQDPLGVALVPGAVCTLFILPSVAPLTSDPQIGSTLGPVGERTKTFRKRTVPTSSQLTHTGVHTHKHALIYTLTYLASHLRHSACSLLIHSHSLPSAVCSSDLSLLWVCLCELPFSHSFLPLQGI